MFVFVVAVASFAQPPNCLADESPIDISLAKQYFEELRQLCDAEGGKLWGKNLYGPFMFVDPASRRVCANQADLEGWLVEKDGVFVGKLPEEENVANTAQKLAGVHWTMVMWPAMNDRVARGRLFTHELYHRIQGDIGLGAISCDNGHLDQRDARVWLRMEWRALGRALKSSGDARKNAVEDALVFRRYRQSLFSDSRKNECAFEMHEGIAEYTGMKASGMVERALPAMAAMQLGLFDSRPNFVYSFAYASGPAYGILLDAAGADWRKSARPQTDLGELLRKAYKVTLPGDLAAESTKRIEPYNGREVIGEEDVRYQESLKKLAKFQARFVDGPTLTLPMVKGINYAYDPNRINAFGDKGQVFEYLRASDVWGILEVKTGGGLLVRDEQGNMILKVVVPAPTDANARPLVGDGWTLTLEKGWTLKAGERKGDYVVAKSGG